MKKKLLLLLLLSLTAALSLSAQTAKPGWTLYSINGGAITLSVPGTLKLYQSKDKGFSAVKNADGSYAVKSDEEILFVPIDENRDLDKEEVGISHFVLVQIDNEEDGLAKVVKVMRNSALVRSAMGFAMKKGMTATVHSDDKEGEMKILESSKVTTAKIGGTKAITWTMSIEDGKKRQGDTRIYMMEKGGTGYVLFLMSQKGKTGFTKNDINGVASSFRLR